MALADYLRQKVWFSALEEGVVEVQTLLVAQSEFVKVVHIQLSSEGLEGGLIEVLGHDFGHEGLRVFDREHGAVLLPRDQVSELGVVQYIEQLQDEGWNFGPLVSVHPSEIIIKFDREA